VTGAGFPCLVRGSYSGCIGTAPCAALGTPRCWTGHTLAPSAPGALLYEVKTSTYQSRTPCATCEHAIEMPGISRPPLNDGEYSDARLFTCAQGHWFGLSSLHQLHNHRMPLRADVQDGSCPDYAATHEMRPELLQQRQADAERARRRRLRQRQRVG